MVVKEVLQAKMGLVEKVVLAVEVEVAILGQRLLTLHQQMLMAIQQLHHLQPHIVILEAQMDHLGVMESLEMLCFLREMMDKMDYSSLLLSICNGPIKYLDKYDLKIIDFTIMFPEEDEVVEPGEEGYVTSLTIKNNGQMPSPIYQDF
jgi:hypothetical protein